MLCPNCNTTLILRYFSINDFDILFCKTCLTGFTSPVPKNLSKYYHTRYWLTPGILGNIKRIFFKIFQLRRRHWINYYLKGGEILDVGAGEGNFGRSLSSKFQVTSIDPSSRIENKDVLRIDFLKWKVKRKFDAIVFWESLEHTPVPQKYLEKSSKLLKRGGFIFIEYPRFDCLESKIFRGFWFHLDPPRHLSHLTEKGIEIMLSRVNLAKYNHLTTSAFEYSIWGTVASILNLFNTERTDTLKYSSNIYILIFITPVAFFVVVFQLILRSINQSPIGLMVAKKMDLET